MYIGKSRGGGSQSGNTDAFQPEHPGCEGTSLRQLAGLPTQGCSTNHLPARPVAGWTVALLSIDGPTVWDQPITAARPRRNWRGPLSAPHFPFHPALTWAGAPTALRTLIHDAKAKDNLGTSRHPIPNPDPASQSQLRFEDRIADLGFRVSRFVRCALAARELRWLRSQPLRPTTSIHWR